MNHTAVRRIGPDDWRAWRAVRLAALADAPEVLGRELSRAEAYDEAAWRERLDPGSGVWVLAETAGGPVGQVGAWLPFGDAPTLVSLWVDPTHRGRGVGDALVRDVLAWAHERRHHSVRLWVLENNAPARALYRRHGFVATRQFMPYPDVPRLREQLMVRDLRPGTDRVSAARSWLPRWLRRAR